MYLFLLSVVLPTLVKADTCYKTYWGCKKYCQLVALCLEDTAGTFYCSKISVAIGWFNIFLNNSGVFDKLPRPPIVPDDFYDCRLTSI